MKKIELINRNKRGITLISLIVTIIVLLILAGVSLSFITGEDGIIKRAIDSKNVAEDAQVKEIVGLAYSQAYIKSFQEETDIANSMRTELERDYGVGNVEVSNNNGTYIVEISEKGIYYIDSNGTVGNTSRPEIAYEITQTNGNELVDGVTYTEALIKINVSNKADLDEIISIELYNEGEKIDSVTLNLIDGEVTFKITSNRTYQAKIATNKVTSTKPIEVKNVITAQVFNRYYTEGKIDVVWLDTSNNVISAPNAPVLTKKEGNTTYGLTAVEYAPTQDDYWKEADTSKEWYRYVAQPRRVGDTETGTSKWANARAKDGSLLVFEILRLKI